MYQYNNGISKNNKYSRQYIKPSKFSAINQVEINDYTRRTYNTNSQIKFKTTTLKSSLCYYSDAQIILKGTITIVGQEADKATNAADRADK